MKTYLDHSEACVMVRLDCTTLEIKRFLIANESVTALLTLADNSIAVASVEDNSNIYKVRILNMQEMRFTHEYTHNGKENFLDNDE